MTDIVAAGMVVQSGTVWLDKVPETQPSMSLRGIRIVQNCVEVIRERSIGKRSARAILGGMNERGRSICQHHKDARNRGWLLPPARGRGTASAMPWMTARRLPKVASVHGQYQRMLLPCDDLYWTCRQTRTPSTGAMVDATATMLLRARNHHRAHELRRQQARASSCGHAPSRRRRAVEV